MWKDHRPNCSTGLIWSKHYHLPTSFRSCVGLCTRSPVSLQASCPNRPCTRGAPEETSWWMMGGASFRSTFKTIWTIKKRVKKVKHLLIVAKWPVSLARRCIKQYLNQFRFHLHVTQFVLEAPSRVANDFEIWLSHVPNIHTITYYIHRLCIMLNCKSLNSYTHMHTGCANDQSFKWINVIFRQNENGLISPRIPPMTPSPARTGAHMKTMPCKGKKHNTC